MTIDALIFKLETFLRENPDWKDAEVVVWETSIILTKDSVIKTVRLYNDI